jgi:hypothetical protein
MTKRYFDPALERKWVCEFVEPRSGNVTIARKAFLRGVELDLPSDITPSSYLFTKVEIQNMVNKDVDNIKRRLNGSFKDAVHEAYDLLKAKAAKAQDDCEPQRQMAASDQGGPKPMQG